MTVVTTAILYFYIFVSPILHCQVGVTLIITINEHAEISDIFYHNYTYSTHFSSIFTLVITLLFNLFFPMHIHSICKNILHNVNRYHSYSH